MSTNTLHVADDTSAKALPRFVELIRVSSQGQADRDTPARQRSELDRFRLRRPGALVERIEAVASGALPLDQTPEGRRISHLARAGAFDELRIAELDRVLGGRADDPRDRLAVFSMALDAGAVLVDTSGQVIDPADESGMGEMSYYLKTFMGSRERKLILRRTMGGRRRCALEGKFIGGHFTFWLKWDKTTKAVTVLEERVKIIKRAGDLAITRGLGTYQIAGQLERDGIPAPKGGKWSAMSLGRLLRNRALIGDHAQRLQGQTYQMAVPPVVDRQWFDAVQKVLDGRKGKPRAACISKDALCRGRVLCGECGEVMHVINAANSKGRYYYKCRSHHRRAKGVLERCANRMHQVETIDEAVWGRLVAFVRDPVLLREAAELPRGTTGASDAAEVQRCEGELERDAKYQVTLARQQREGLLTDEAVERMLKEQAHRRRTLQDRLDEARGRLEAMEAVSRALPGLEDRLASIQGAVEAADFATRRAVLETLVPRLPGYGVKLFPEGMVEVKGALNLDGAGSPSPSVVTISPKSCSRFDRNLSLPFTVTVMARKG